MRVIVIGLGVQGRKRLRVATSDVVATVDPVAEGVDFRSLQDVPLDAYDAALCCVPDDVKQGLVRHLLVQAKHVLVEKPLVAADGRVLEELKQIAETRRVVCYTAYNHRFEPHVAALEKLLAGGELGQVYVCKLFYGNGTAREVRSSPWRDKGLGVISDLGSHLLDLTRFLFGVVEGRPEIWAAERFENQAFDYCRFALRGRPRLEYEMTLLSWRNTFRLDLLAEHGTAHIDGLCKWGPSTLTVRKRILPSGQPDERAETLVCADPTWDLEYQHFRELCRSPSHNLDTDIWINDVFNGFRRELGLA